MLKSSGWHRLVGVSSCNSFCFFGPGVYPGNIILLLMYEGYLNMDDSLRLEKGPTVKGTRVLSRPCFAINFGVALAAAVFNGFARLMAFCCKPRKGEGPCVYSILPL